MGGPTYPAARQVALGIEELLRAYALPYSQPGDAPRPDAEAMEEIISTAFWASLLREEGREPKISLALLPPEQSELPLRFERRLQLNSHALTHLAPAVERPGIHLGVCREDGLLGVWGTTRTLPAWCFVLEVVGPGLLVVKYRRPEPSVKYANVVVIEGAAIKFIDQDDSIVTEARPALRSILDFYQSAGRTEADNVFVRLAISMRSHGRGGSLLVVPAGSSDWQHSIARPITYQVNPPFSELAHLLNQCELRNSGNPREEIRAAVEALAGLTEVDGATLLTDQFDLLAFGVKIVARNGQAVVDKVLLTEPVRDSVEVMVDATRLGGTRHLSAAQFVQDQRDAIALVASQDGRFTVFAWSDVHNLVRAHRLESLLI